MLPPQLPVQPTAQGEQRKPAARQLHGRRLVFARAMCIVIVAFTLSLLGIGLVTPLPYYSSICTGLTCILPIPEALVYFAVAGLIFRYRSDDWMAMVVALMLVLMVPFSTLPEVTINLLGDSRIMQVCLYVSIYLTFAFFLLFCFLFPSGRFVPRWTRWVVGIYLLWLVSLFGAILGWWFNWMSTDLGWNLYLVAVVVILLLFIVCTQLYRYWEVSNPVERQQSKWAIAGTAIAIWVWALLLFAWGSDSRVILLLIPLSLGIAVLRYHLYDIEVLINRALIYGTLTGTLALIYFGLVFGLQFLLGGLVSKTNGVVLVFSTLTVYALFQPLRRRIQQAIDRRFYRRKYDAAKTEAFSASLRNEVDLAQLSEHLITVVQETVQPAHVSLWLRPTDAHDGMQQASWRVSPLVSFEENEASGVRPAYLHQ